MQNMQSNELTGHYHCRPYKDRKLEVQMYMDHKGNNRWFLSTKGLPFVLEIVHELVLENSPSRADLQGMLSKLLDGLGAKFVSGLLDLIIGDNPEVHSFRLDAEGYICPHQPH